MTGAEPLHWLPAESKKWIWGRAIVLASAFLTGLAPAAARGLGTNTPRPASSSASRSAPTRRSSTVASTWRSAAEAAQAQTFFAAIALDSGRADALWQVLSASHVAGRRPSTTPPRASRCSAEWATPSKARMHLYLKRAHVSGTCSGRRPNGCRNEVLAELITQERHALPRGRSPASRCPTSGRVDDKGPYELIAQASRRALADAGLTPDDVDGLASTGQGTLPPVDVGEYLGLRPRAGWTPRRSAARRGR